MVGKGGVGPTGDERPRGRPPMSEHRRASSRLEISREAVRLFREQGVAGTTGDQIAAAAGLSGRTLWRYFRTKESCVEPLLAQSAEAFAETLRRWPAGTSLVEHLVSGYRMPDGAVPGDGEAVLAIVRMAREDLALRAHWLVVHERNEAALAAAIAARLGRGVDDLEVRVQAATLCAALRIATEDLAAARVSGAQAGERREPIAHLTATVRAATHGILGDAVAVDVGE